METTGHHTLNDLFAQLGLASDDAAIDEFLIAHYLHRHEKLAAAPFWTQGQREFLEEAIRDDSDWCVAVDELDSLLRH
ncbi:MULTISPECIES: DUF2789 family protein [unclassified Microbulbifer]|uniref:DUF2789 domain-containing protein n=1 Tax=Microbulbifer spongiae TaxID=2944933 RepID=A0ABY9E7K1_9GAMM|nr:MULTISPECIES: DUF2789 family protein [unclassified Microbulbifer]MDP5209558.1 DUF2789 family protein [Microbulbifer sp. 2205BS26-8]WKD49014.1 DUF2789 domain-containing protein [Microbulbifer sp. MI-G]